MRDPKRIHRMAGKLEIIWRTVPDQRLGQLVENIIRFNSKTPQFFLEDDEMEKILDKIIETST